MVSRYVFALQNPQAERQGASFLERQKGVKNVSVPAFVELSPESPA
jgi:hypothetical protein